MSNQNAFVPGELPIYEKYEIECKRTMFGLMKIWYYIIKIANVFGDGAEVVPKDCWHKTTTEFRFHRDRLFITVQKRLLIWCWFKKYGKKEYKVMISEIESISRSSSNIYIEINNNKIKIPTGKGTDWETVNNIIRDLKIVKPLIRENG